MRNFFVLCSLLFAIRGSAQSDSLSAMLQQGTRLHDQGDYDGAIRLYDRILAADSGYYLAFHEKSLTLLAAGKYQECIDICRRILQEFPNNEQNGRVYTNYGSALDAMGDGKTALEVYTEGIQKYPREHLLFFNRGITEYAAKDYDLVIRDMEQSLQLKPTHPGSHQALAYCLYYHGNKVAADMALATFLLFEPTGARAEKNLQMLAQWLTANVSKKDDKNVVISVSPDMLDTTNKGEDNFHTTELMLTLGSAMDDENLKKGQSPAEILKTKLEYFALADAPTKGFFSNFYVRLFAGLKKAGLLEVASHMMELSANDQRDQDWLNQHEKKVKELQKWVDNWRPFGD